MALAEGTGLAGFLMDSSDASSDCVVTEPLSSIRSQPYTGGLGEWAQRGKIKGARRKPGGKANGRARLTNGKDLLPDVDGRSLLYKRFKDIARLVAADQGGLDALSEARVQLVRRFAATCVLAERIEADMCNGLEFDINQHTALSMALVRLGSRIGIDRRAKHITPNLTDYLELQSAPERPERADPIPNAPVSKGDE